MTLPLMKSLLEAQHVSESKTYGLQLGHVMRKRYQYSQRFSQIPLIRLSIRSEATEMRVISTYYLNQ